MVGTHGSSRDRAVSSVLSVVLLIAVVVVIAMVVVVGALTFLPDGDASPRPDATFSFDRDSGGVLTVVPEYMQDGVTFDLLINGRNVYSWEGDGLTEDRRLRCLFPGDEVLVRADMQGDRSYVMARHEVDTATACPLTGTSVQVASAIVEDARVQLFEPTYEFTLKLDPQGAGAGEDPVPVTNGWHYVQRFDRSLEGLDGPTYVIVLADNADYDDDPPEGNGADSFEIVGDQVVARPGGSEPTNDIYLVFSPGCQESKLKLVDVRASYANDVLLGDTIVVEDTSAASVPTVYNAPGVTCKG